MYLVYEEDVVLAELGEDGDHVAGALDGGAGGGLDADAHLGCEDVGEGGLAESGRAVEQGVVERLSALSRRGDCDIKVGLEQFLAHVVLEPAGAQTGVQVVFFLGCS